MYSELRDEFHGLDVVDFSEADHWQGPGFAYRVGEEYDDPTSVGDRLKMLLEQDGAEQISALVIGGWKGACEGDDTAEVIKTLAELAPQLPKLRALFLGEMTYEQCEISWIKQSDVSPLLAAFPQLETFRVRGGEGLSFSRVRHDSLKELAIETGGLPRSVVREIFLCDFPALEHLELLFGEENYGFDGSVEDLQPLLSGEMYPQLKYLGLMNCPLANDIAAVVVNSPIVDRIAVLDLSMGTLDGNGLRSLKALAGKMNLQTVNVSHHYASEEEIEDLQNALSCELIADDPQEPDGDWRGVLHAE